MGLKFETSAVPPREQHDFWLDLIRSHLHVRMDIRPREQRPHFHGALDVKSAGGLQLLHIANEAADVVREPRHVTSSDPEVMVIHLVLEGSSGVEHDGRITWVGPGDLALVDTTCPGGLHFSSHVRKLVFPLLREPLLARLGTRTLPKHVRIAGQHGVGALAGSLLRSIYEQAETLDAESAAVATEQAMSLMTLALGRADAQPGDDEGDGEPRLAQAGRLRQIQAYIEAQLTDPALCPERVAAANRVSLRYLYKLFASAELSVSEWIRERRLVHCAEALASPALAERGVAELAFSWGFADQSHFSRAFKRRFGVSPGEYRRQRRAATGSRAEPASLAACAARSTPSRLPGEET